MSTVQCPAEAPREVIVLTPPASPNSVLSRSFSSCASCGPEAAAALRSCPKLGDAPATPPPAAPAGEDEESEEEEAEVLEARAREAARRRALADGPSRRCPALDRQSVAAARQNALNEFILRHERARTVAREDHRIMTHQLVSEARRHTGGAAAAEERAAWRALVVAVRRQYCGGVAVLSLAPDPYQAVLSTLSSMMLWNEGHRRLRFEYSDAAVTERRARQQAVIDQLNREGKLFL